MAERNIQPTASASTASMWKHGCSCFQLEDHQASIIKFSTQLRKSEANYKLCNYFGLVSVFSRALLHTLAFQHIVQQLFARVEMQAA